MKGRSYIVGMVVFTSTGLPGVSANPTMTTYFPIFIQHIFNPYLSQHNHNHPLIRQKRPGDGLSTDRGTKDKTQNRHQETSMRWKNRIHNSVF